MKCPNSSRVDIELKTKIEIYHSPRLFPMLYTIFENQVCEKCGYKFSKEETQIDMGE